jgi:fatty-acyl-CoA synthase
VVIADPENGNVKGVEEMGEILIHGPQVFKGYWARDDETKSSFVDIDGAKYFRTGDIGYRDTEGYHFMADRIKRMINASGFKIWPSEVENKLYEHPAIAEACVIGKKDAYRGETAKALVVLRPGAQASEADIIAWSKERMAAYKYPRSVEFVRELPKAYNGKIQWRELQAQEDARAE